VLPPDEFNSIIPIPLLIYPESFITAIATVSDSVAMVANIATHATETNTSPANAGMM